LSLNESATPADRVELDPLTGAMTRQAFCLRLIERANIVNTTAQTFAICLVDADQLKTANRSHGQQTGDEVLVQVTRRIRLELAIALPETEQIDLRRYDGNGFTFLIPVSDLEHASSIAENLRRAIGATDMKRGVRVTVSAGVAQYRLWESAEETLGRAEQALHLAKQFGRDRAEVIPLQPTA
jgi:diguanylate cyclase (GGDEF)-like protein